MIERAVATLTLGRTAIVIAHRLSTVERVDQVIILEEGRIAEQGLRAVLASQPGSLFARLRAEGFGEALR
jgi:ABC-type multidrug transport system fused ATPase/permease subunit